MDLNRPRVAAWALLLMACSVPAFDYAMGAAGPPNRDLLAERLQAHLSIVTFEDTALSPYRYRVLAPLVIHAVTLPISRFVAYNRAFEVVSGLFYAGALLFLLVTLKRYLELWFQPVEALAGTLATAATLPIVLRQHIYTPWSWLEPPLLLLGLVWIVERRTMPVVLLTIVATLNRETGVLIPVAWLIDALAARPRFGRETTRALASVGASLAIVLGLHLAIGPGPSAATLAHIWSVNSSGYGFLKAIVNATLFLGGAGWILAAYGFRRAPVFVRRLGWLAAVYVPVYLVGGIWYEVRLLMPLYPVLVPAALAAVYEPSRLPSHAGAGGAQEELLVRGTDAPPIEVARAGTATRGEVAAPRRVAEQSLHRAGERR